MKSWIVIASVSLASTAMGVLLGIYVEKHRDISFNSQLWQLGNIAQTVGGNIEPFRHKMVNNLFKDHGLVGRSKAEVIALLGDEATSCCLENNRMYYWLNEEYFCLLCIDPTSVATLVLELTSSGYVEKAYVSL